MSALGICFLSIHLIQVNIHAFDVLALFAHLAKMIGELKLSLLKICNKIYII